MGTAVAWILVAALVTVACVAGFRLQSALRGRLPAGRGAGALVHLAMALGMALMAVPFGGVLPDTAPRVGFGALGAVLAVGSLVASARRGPVHGRHGLHHAAMCGVMVLMAAPTRGGAAMTGMAPGMAMPDAVNGAAVNGVAVSGVAAPSPLVLAAFGYACVVALLFAWRMPRPNADPLGHACEITMLTSTVVMLPPML